MADQKMQDMVKKSLLLFDQYNKETTFNELTVDENILKFHDQLQKDYTEKEYFIMSNAMDMYASLLLSIEQAGGSCSSFTPYPKIEEMTVLELITNLATNGIRFTNGGVL